MRNTVKLSTLALLVASLSACSAGPDYQRPEKVESINLSQPYQQVEQGSLLNVGQNAAVALVQVGVVSEFGK